MIQTGYMIVLFCLLTFSPVVEATTGQEIVAQIRQTFEKAEALSVEFKRTLYWKMADTRQEVKGKLLLRKPDAFRLETPLQVVVTDGRTIWSYGVENEQVIVSPYQRSDDPSSPERILFAYSDAYDAEYVGAEKIRRKLCDVVHLTPKEKDSNIVWMKVWVDRKGKVALKVHFVDVNENEITYELSKIRMNPKLSEALFQFEVPEGVDVVDMR